MERVLEPTAGKAERLFRSARISVNPLPCWLMEASTKNSSSIDPDSEAGGKFATGTPVESCASRATAPVKPAL